MFSKREKVIAGEVAMVANELTTLSRESLVRVYLDVGPKRWKRLARAIATAEQDAKRPN